MDEIFDAVKYTALIHKSGGGTGFSFSRLRPPMTWSCPPPVSPPAPLLHAGLRRGHRDHQTGGTRRGANMGILRVDHPNIMDSSCARPTRSN